MEKKSIATETAPQAIGPYAQGIRAKGELVFVSGQIPVDPVTADIVSEDVQEQTRRCLENVKAILEAAGAGLANVVKTTLYIKDMEDFARINEIYGSYFTENPPARACVEVARLPKDVRIEVEAIAVM